MPRAPRERTMEKRTVGKVYSVGIYARLSVDSHNEKNESIETQIKIAKGYLSRQEDMALYDCYSDLGRTGTDFEREGFDRLMQDVRRHLVDCIIVKDFSRFGRNYVEMGNYLERIFPFLGVRFVSVTDGFDSVKTENNPDALGTNLKHLVNELYARDIGVKVRAAKEVKWQQGSYTGGIPAYGYQARWENGKKLLYVEEEPARVVRKLYDLYGAGKNQKELVEWLYGNQIHPPKAYRRTGHVYRQEGEELCQWDRGTIRNLLQNPVYLGHLVQAHSYQKMGQKEGRRDAAEGDWGMKKNTHEPIVSEELFFSAAQRFREQEVYCNRKGFSRTVPMEDDKMEGVLFCGECKRPMSRTANVKVLSSGDRIRLYGYFCHNSRRIDGTGCERKYLAWRDLEEILKESLKKEFLLAGIVPGRILKERKRLLEEKQRVVKKRKLRLEDKIQAIQRQASEKYVKYRQGLVEEGAFLYWKEEKERQSRVWKQEIPECDREIKEAERLSKEQCHFLRNLLKFNETSRLDKDIVKALIDRIEVYPGNRIEIFYQFPAVYFVSCSSMKDERRPVRDMG